MRRSVECGAQQGCADRPAACRNDDIELLFGGLWLFRGDKAGVDDALGDLLGQRKGLFQADEVWISVDQHRIEVALDQIDGFVVAAGFGALLQDIAKRCHDQRPLDALFNGRKQRQQFEAHLAAAERKGLDDDDIGPRPMIGAEQHAGAVVLEGLIHRGAVCIDEA